MIKVYVAGLYSRNEKGEEAGGIEVLQNIERGTRISVELMLGGYAVFCPWLDHQFAFYQPNMDKQCYMDNSMAWLEVSDAVLVISGAGMGGGVDREIKRATELNIPVYYHIFALNQAQYVG